MSSFTHHSLLSSPRDDGVGRKWTQKLYRKHSGFPGGLKEVVADTWRQKHPERILEHSIRGKD